MKPYYEHAGITIYHGDCREILPEIVPVALVLTDPPYGTQNLSGGYGRHSLHSLNGKTGMTIVGDEDLNVLQSSAQLIVAAMESNAWLISFCAARRMIETALIYQEAGTKLFGELIWDKGIPGLGFTIRYAHESALVFKKGDPQKGSDAVMSIQRETIDHRNMGIFSKIR